MLVSLKVGFQVIFCESFVNLEEFSVVERHLKKILLYLCKRIFFIGLFVSELRQSPQPKKTSISSRLYQPMICSRGVL